jgi:hypothetical protein
MNVYRGVCLAVALLSLVACEEKDGDPITPTTPPATTLTPTPPPVATPPADLKVDAPAAKMSIEARVKTELDGRADGITGSPLAAAGALASLQTPAGWTTSKSGDFSVAASADKKAQLAASGVGAEGAAGKLPAAATALGLTSCEWGTPEPVTIGKGKLAGVAADGVCTRGTTQIRAAYVSPTAEKLLVVGVWDPGGDVAGMFGAMRSIAKAAGGDPTGIAACCSALRGNAKSAPPEQQAALLFAAGVCDGVKNSPEGRAVLAQVRAGLAGAQVPSSCR